MFGDDIFLHISTLETWSRSSISAFLIIFTTGLGLWLTLMLCVTHHKHVMGPIFLPGSVMQFVGLNHIPRLDLWYFGRV